ncbi:hypothetical protein [Caulobacter sp. B11]|nr:hypothetical protein [Caulobacter sp. B11]
MARPRNGYCETLAAEFARAAADLEAAPEPMIEAPAATSEPVAQDRLPY